MAITTETKMSLVEKMNEYFHKVTPSFEVRYLAPPLDRYDGEAIVGCSNMGGKMLAPFKAEVSLYSDAVVVYLKEPHVTHCYYRVPLHKCLEYFENMEWELQHRCGLAKDHIFDAARSRQSFEPYKPLSPAAMPLHTDPLFGSW